MGGVVCLYRKRQESLAAGVHLTGAVTGIKKIEGRDFGIILFLAPVRNWAILESNMEVRKHSGIKASSAPP